METIIVEVKKYCDFNEEFLCLDEKGLICVKITGISEIMPIDRLKMVGKTFEFGGKSSFDGNQFFAARLKEVHGGR